MKPSIKIGTRASKLALWQANWVQSALNEEFPDQKVELVKIKTKGDKILDVPLAKVGGKGLFVKEIEQALLEGRIDLAVHSMKDMPAEIPDGLCIGAIPQREDPADVLVAREDLEFSNLRRGAVIGTSSLRRAAQLRHVRPDISISPLRGNLDTRLKKLQTENLDAIVLAAAGIKRLNLAHRITEYLPSDIMLPAVGQGALCIEMRQEDPHHRPHVSDPGSREFPNGCPGGTGLFKSSGRQLPGTHRRSRRNPGRHIQPDRFGGRHGWQPDNQSRLIWPGRQRGGHRC